ncbi:MAG TPA: OmpA family protein [Tepidisphaeraceae bacterium]|nr:OmpA family protein [Tepidisphaeraceae bacterium]
MARMLRWLGLATVSFALTGGLFGCVSQEKYEGVVSEKDAALQQLDDANTNLASLSAENQSLKAQLADLQNQSGTQTGLTSNLNSQIDQLTAESTQWKTKYEDLLNKIPQVTEISYGSGPLPQPLSDALTQFAQENPDVVEFDAERGVVKFKSDVTFPTGQFTLSPEAKSAIDKFATILNSPAASGYELMVVGHTDNVPVSTPGVKRFSPDNWYLSCHRAISVGEELMRQGVDQGRIGMAGYGQERPIADNSTSEGRSANRRVEVLILPTKHMGRSMASAPRRESNMYNKDSAVETQTGQEFNK